MPDALGSISLPLGKSHLHMRTQLPLKRCKAIISSKTYCRRRVLRPELLLRLFGRAGGGSGKGSGRSTLLGPNRRKPIGGSGGGRQRRWGWWCRLRRSRCRCYLCRRRRLCRWCATAVAGAVATGNLTFAVDATARRWPRSEGRDNALRPASASSARQPELARRPAMVTATVAA